MGRTQDFRLAVRLLFAAPLLLAAACASGPETADGPEAALDPAALSTALDAELFGGGSINLSATLASGRPVALVFWQAW
ncbi:MAG: hypothetical protein P1V81_17140 [Planctomycetota bacterium]|nr:hypothetical protein [Planctomycetota bacterium]